jgi:hypothetical protein
MRCERANFWFGHLFGMLFGVKENKATDPPDLSALGAEAEVFDPDNISHLIG